MATWAGIGKVWADITTKSFDCLLTLPASNDALLEEALFGQVVLYVAGLVVFAALLLNFRGYWTDLINHFIVWRCPSSGMASVIRHVLLVPLEEWAVVLFLTNAASILFDSQWQAMALHDHEKPHVSQTKLHEEWEAWWILLCSGALAVVGGVLSHWKLSNGATRNVPHFGQLLLFIGGASLVVVLGVTYFIQDPDRALALVFYILTAVLFLVVRSSLSRFAFFPAAPFIATVLSWFGQGHARLFASAVERGFSFAETLWGGLLLFPAVVMTGFLSSLLSTMMFALVCRWIGNSRNSVAVFLRLLFDFVFCAICQAWSIRVGINLAKMMQELSLDPSVVRVIPMIPPGRHWLVSVSVVATLMIPAIATVVGFYEWAQATHIRFLPRNIHLDNVAMRSGWHDQGVRERAVGRGSQHFRSLREMISYLESHLRDDGGSEASHRRARMQPVGALFDLQEMVTKAPVLHLEFSIDVTVRPIVRD